MSASCRLKSAVAAAAGRDDGLMDAATVGGSIGADIGTTDERATFAVGFAVVFYKLDC